MDKILLRKLNNNDVVEILALIGKNYLPKLSETFIGYGLFINEEIVSIAFLSIFYICPNDDSKNGLVGEISGVFTKKEQRNNGFAKQCVEKLIDYGKNVGTDYITIDSLNTAIQFYDSIGFKFQSDNESRMYIIPN